MNITINGLTIGLDNPYIKLAPPVQGLFSPPLRAPVGNLSGTDGGYVNPQFKAPREITINGFILADSCDVAFQARCQLQKALPIRQMLPMFIETLNGKTYFTEVSLLDLKMDYERAKYQEFQITVVAPDPNFYDAGDGIDPDSGWIEQIIYKTMGGGYVTPYVLTVEWRPGQTPAVVTNTGNIWIYPQIVLEGKWTNPRITNTTTGQFVELSVATSSSDKIVIDMKARTITLNGYSILPYRHPDSSWWYLDFGDNIITLMSTSGSDEQVGIIRYRQAYTGIFTDLC